MNKFYAADGQFWLNNQPLLIQAGEFHYFRTPQDEWPHRLNLLKEAGFNAVAAYIPWLWHQVEEDVSDFDGHSHPMRNLAGFLDLADEMGLYVIARPGPYINAETTYEGIPAWVFRKYPQVAAINQRGEPENIVSYLHPDFTAQVKKWYREVYQVIAPRQITRKGKILLVQLDNEMGMMHWVKNIMDINENTLKHFAAHLKLFYGEQLVERYPVENLIELLRNGIMHPDDSRSRQIVEDYRLFFRAYLRQYASFLLAEATANGLEVPPVINIHGFANGGKTFAIGISQLISVMDMDGMISAVDVYPGWIGEANIHQLLMVNEMTKAVENRSQPLFSIEFQAGGNQDFGIGQTSLYDLYSRLCISSGMRAINHYLFCDGENDPILSTVKRHDWGHPVRKDGSLRKHYFRYPQLSRVLKCYGKDLVLSQPHTVATVGFQLDDFMTEVNNEATQETTRIITHQREVVLFDFIARGLTLTHRPFDAVEINREELEPARTPVCWVMMDRRCNPAVQQKLVEYARQGGRLILVGRMCSEDFNHQPCTILRNALGIQGVESDPPFTQNLVNAFGYTDIPVSFMETYTGEFDEVFARHLDGRIVGFNRKIGLGEVMMLGAALPADTLDDLDLVHQMGLRMGCQPLFHADPWVDVRISRGENGSFLFINNYQDDPVESRLGYDQIQLFGGNPVQIPARRGVILPLDWWIKQDVLLHYITSEIIEINTSDEIIEIKTALDEFTAELTLLGYSCDESVQVEESSIARKVRVQARNGVIRLQRNH